MKQWFLYPLLATAVTALLCALTSIPLAWAAFIAFLGWPIIGTFVTADDDLPGGWANPDGLAVPQWETAEFRGQLLGGAAIVALAFALQERSSSAWFWLLLCISLALGLFSSYFLPRAFQSIRSDAAARKG